MEPAKPNALEQEAIIKVRGLTKHYKDIKAVDSLDMTVYRGDIYGFLGPNGAGKSTTIRMLLTLISAQAGTIELFGMPLHTHRSEILQKLGALIEKPDFYPYLSAYDNLRILMRVSGLRPNKTRIGEVLNMVGLGHRAQSKVKTYSQGMKQRLGIAQALIHEPEMIILDEPANGLDPQGQKEMRSLLERLNEQHGLTILLSSHILSEIELIANRMIIINQGQGVVEGRVKNLLDGNEMVVHIDTDQPEQAAKRLAISQGIQPEIENEGIRLVTSREVIPGIIKQLNQAGIPIYAVRPVRSLEDYFLKLTQHA